MEGKQTPFLRMEVKQAYRYLWLKYVRGFDQRVHCANCLIGDYSTRIRFNLAGERARPGDDVRIALDEYEAPYLYLCGVSYGGWATNLHVPMRPQPGAEIVHEDERIRLYVHGMERIELHPVPEAEGRVVKAFWSCRNWQFGWQQFPESRRPLEEAPGLMKRAKVFPDMPRSLEIDLPPGEF